tara:strand:+ start:1906 stop:2280 length:375 start_codon:yes stop_codon:yes gene_type:complete
MSKELRYRSIKEMLSLLDSSKKIYKNYLSDGRKFLYAKDLRSINEKIVNLINTQKFEKDEVLKPAFQNLKKHLEEWICAWDREKINKTPNDNDKFTFSGYRTYPKYLDKLLISHLENMTNRGAG